MTEDGKKTCYFIQQSVRDENGNFIPCIAVEGEPGYYKTDWTWGKDLSAAEALADAKNQTIGISKSEALKIVLSSMRRR